MAKKKTIGQLVKDALDGRTQRWLSKKTGIPEDKLSNKITGVDEFSENELMVIEVTLNRNIPRPEEKVK